QKLLEIKDEDGIKLLYITPLRSLNRDIFQRIVQLGESLEIEVDVRHGDTSAYIRKLQAESPPDVMITTPETLQLLLFGRKTRKALTHVKFVIIDEVHELINERGYQLSIALERLVELSGEFQRIGISATLGNPKEVGKLFLKEFEVINAFEPKEFEINVELIKPTSKEQAVAADLLLSSKALACIKRMLEILKDARTSLIFVNTRELAEILGLRFRLLTNEVEVHHSSLAREVRINVEEGLKKGKLKGVICTSSLELGIDVGNVDVVIQYMSPRQVTKALQRIGRSGHRVRGISRGFILTIDPLDYFEAQAIRHLAQKGFLEFQRIQEKPYDVLANQIIAMLLSLGELKKEYVYKVIRRAYPFKDLKIQEFEDLLQFLREIRLIEIRGERIYKLPKALTYFLENISLIPDEKQYLVIDKEMNRPIGILHQEFMAHCEEGAIFSLKGESWRVVEIKEDKVFVIREKADDPLIPGWEGELIPVPYEVATMARDLLAEALLQKSWEVKELEGQTKFFIPRQNEIYVERIRNIFILFTFFGNKLNATLEELLVCLLSQRCGKVESKSDAYRIILRFDGNFRDLKNAILSIEPKGIRYLLRYALKNSERFMYHFFHVARRFGVIRKSSGYSRGIVSKLIQASYNTKLFEEAFNEYVHEKLDLQRAEEIFELLREGKTRIKFIEARELSPLARLSLESKLSIFRSEESRKELLKAVEARIQKRKLFLICMHCKTQLGEFTVESISEDLKCKRCGARAIGCISQNRRAFAEAALIKQRVGRKLNLEEKKAYNELMESAELFLNYGKIAFFVLSAHGIGPKSAKKILAGSYKDKEELLSKIIDFERKFLKYRRFWKD
ncbi:MAG: DEAD/DEAH box helicase, partial [Candidatus Parvarchaeota archaeon]|nr:DEAD/DEAH box helicase [Candidatus Haiyanarchaeum thermophilum]